MNKSQPQYLIRANSACKTHRKGTEIIMTGPRSGVANGWTVIRRYYQEV